MKKILLLTFGLIVGFACTDSVLVAGIIIGAEVPNIALEVIAGLDDKFKKEIQELTSEQDEHRFLFDAATKYYLPHLTIAYLVNGNNSDITLEDLLAGANDNGEFRQALSAIAQSSVAIDLTENFAQAELEFWQGKFPVELTLDGADKKFYENYYLIVLKIKESQALLDLAEKVRGLVDQKLTIKQRFPFGGHLTVGRVVSTDDHISVKELVENRLKSKFAGKKVNELVPVFMVQELKLKDDKQEELYRLRAN
jgi:2'-5' RNA ligase